MDEAHVDELAELRDGMISLLQRMEHVEEETNVDLSPLRLDMERLLAKLERNVRGRRGVESAVMTFDRLLTLNQGFGAVAGQWAAVRRSAGAAAATEIISISDLQEKWREKWGGSADYAWHVRSRVEERAARADVAARSRASGEVPPLGLMLDLRYGTDLPLTRIAEFFDVSAAAVQARVAGFETDVAREIALAITRADLAPDWRLETRSAEGDFELRLPAGQVLVFEVMPTRLERDSGAGRPREPGALFRRSQGEARVWVLVEFMEPRLVFLPDGRAREFTKGTASARHATIDQIVRLAPHLGFANLHDLVEDGTGGSAMERA
jgi:hypothetical protein